MPKIIKVGGNLTKLWQKQFCTVFETRCIYGSHRIMYPADSGLSIWPMK